MATVQLFTERGEELQKALAENPDFRPWNVYPRPQMVRENWINLNGEWEFCALTLQQADAGQTPTYDGKILVPFPVESALSGIGEHFPEGSVLCYRKSLIITEIPTGKVPLLHVDGFSQIVSINLNGELETVRSVSRSKSRDTALKNLRPGENVLELFVHSNLHRKLYPYGKSSLHRGGMWYTPVSGVWQTVWLEWVPERYISDLRITPGMSSAIVELTEETVGRNDVPTKKPPLHAGEGDRAAVEGWCSSGSAPKECSSQIGLPLRPSGTSPASRGGFGAQQPQERYIVCEGKEYPIVDGKATITPEKPHLWTPEDPYLYHFTIKTETDEVKSYFALRTFEAKTVDGVPRLCLNGEPVFLSGLLDQGYWPDGIYTPASPKCYEDDILAAKKLGYNTLRKHIKLEPEQFYYDCDRLGMLVMQDMVNNGRYSFFGDTLLPTLGLQRLPDFLPLRTRGTKDCFRAAMKSTVKRLYNHPSVVCWTIFNEGWGQFAPSENYDRLKALDPTRVIDTTSGWFRGGKTDVESRHVYFKRFRMPKAKKPVVLSEFGGYVWKVAGHSFNPDKTYGYKLFADRESWQAAVEKLYAEQIRPNIEKGLCAAIYTQLSDVEDETNGLLTYDRRIIK